MLARNGTTFFFSSAKVAVWSLLLASCSTSTSPSDGDAAMVADTGAEAGGTGGSGDGASDATGKGGAGGAAGNGASGGGSGGTTGGSAGSDAGGGAAGSGRDGQADTASGDRDATSDLRDSSLGTDTNTDRGADATSPDATGPDANSDATGTDALKDASQPPSDGLACLPLPSAGVYATFRVVSDVFYASITHPTGIDQAIALWRGQSQANIPVGQLECSNGTYNCGWSWRLNPASITFAEITIEVCDATPSYVQGNCASFPNAQYCPWSAELIALRDCRTDTSCPTVTR